MKPTQPPAVKPLKHQSSRQKAAFLGLAASALTVMAAPAAVITWGTATAISTSPGNSSDVSTTGTLVEAFNATITGNTTNVTVNGVLFKPTSKLLNSNVSSPPDFSSGTNGGDAAYDAILSTLDYGNGQVATITIGDGDGDSGKLSAGLLKPGSQYQIQVWFVDDRATFTERTMGYAGSSSGTVVNLNDQYVIGTFTANATTQTLYLDTVSSAPGDAFGNTQITAYQIRETSGTEPGELTLAGFTYNPLDGAAEVRIKGTPNAAYKLTEASDLDFATPEQDPVPLTSATVGTLNGNEVTTDANGDATVRFNLGTSKAATFIRAESAE